MRDLNEDADGCWSQYYENKMSGQNPYNGYQLTPSNGYLDYDKEMFKRTMLEHEAVFRKQVYELHRVYRTQKDMMCELKRGALMHLLPDTSQSNTFSFQVQCDGTNKMLQMAHPPEATTSDNKAPFTVTEDNKPDLTGPVYIGKESALKDGDIFDSNQKELSDRMVDLELPAVYVDCKDEISEKEIVADSSLLTAVPLDRIHGSDPENNVKVNHAMAEGCNDRKDSWKSDMHPQSGLITPSLTDLNQSAREMNFGKASGSVSAKFLFPRTSLADNKGLRLPSRSTIFSVLPSVEGRHCDQGTSTNILPVDHDKTNQRPFFIKEAGQSTSNAKLFCPASAKEKISTLSQQTQLNQKSHENFSLDMKKKEAWLKPQDEISKRSPLDGRTSLPFPISFSSTPLDYTNTTSLPCSSRAKPANGYNHVPLSVPSLQQFNGAISEDHGTSSDILRYSGGLRSQLTGVGPTCYQKGSNDGTKLDYSLVSQLYNSPFNRGKPNLGGRSESKFEVYGPQKSQTDAHLNQTLCNGLENGVSNRKINESEGKCEDLSGAFFWLREKPTSNATNHFMELDLSQGYPQLKCAGTVMNLKSERSQETERSNNLLSSSQIKETTRKNPVSDGQISKKIFGFSIPEEAQQSDALAPHQEQSQTESNEKDKPQLPRLETQIAHPDHKKLNFDLNCSDLPVEDEMLVTPSQVPVYIDLEAPNVLEEELEEILAKGAAESILLISSDKNGGLDDIPFHLPSSVSYDTLHWFAEVVSSNPKTLKETTCDSLDSFELMTLELEETKPEELWCWSLEGRDEKDNEDRKSSIASLLFTKARKQAGKRRRKRDFQKDVLPGIVSLSRQEVTKDLQTIGTLVKAAGGTMVHHVVPRGRACRRAKSLAVTVEEIQVSPPVTQPANMTSDIKVDGQNMTGWGRTTRRCRKQKLPPMTSFAASLT